MKSEMNPMKKKINVNQAINIRPYRGNIIDTNYYYKFNEQNLTLVSAIEYIYQ